MAVIRRGRGSRSRVTLAAGLLAVAAFASMPAHSATPPALVSTSVDNGWANGNFVMARFDQKIAEETAPGVFSSSSTATVTEADGTPVPGTFSFISAQFNLRKDTIVWTANLNGRFDEFGAPLRALPEGDYRINITAVSPVTTQSTTLPTISYKVDASAPFNPVFTGPEADMPFDVDADPVTGDLEISGVVSDRQGSGSGAFKSGIARVSLYFFHGTDPFSYDFVNTPGPGGVGIPTPQNLETTSLRRNASLAPCGTSIAGCTNNDGVVDQDRVFSSTVTGLDPGLWTVKAIAADAAGNQSQEVNVTFLYLG